MGVVAVSVSDGLALHGQQSGLDCGLSSSAASTGGVLVHATDR